MVLYCNPLSVSLPNFMHVTPQEVLLSGQGNYVVWLLSRSPWIVSDSLTQSVLKSTSPNFLLRLWRLRKSNSWFILFLYLWSSQISCM